MIISSANWGLEPVFYKQGSLYICSNSQVHKVAVSETDFVYVNSQKPTEKQNVRCVTCTHSLIVTDSHKVGNNQ